MIDRTNQVQTLIYFHVTIFCNFNQPSTIFDKMCFFTQTRANDAPGFVALPLEIGRTFIFNLAGKELLNVSHIHVII